MSIISFFGNECLYVRFVKFDVTEEKNNYNAFLLNVRIS